MYVKATVTKSPGATIIILAPGVMFAIAEYLVIDIESIAPPYKVIIP